MSYPIPIPILILILLVLVLITVVDEKAYKCELCAKRYKFSSSLYCHLREKHCEPQLEQQHDAECSVAVGSVRSEHDAPVSFWLLSS